MHKWEPAPCSPDLEEQMEALKLPESDRRELRMNAEFLRWKAAANKGHYVFPMNVYVCEWVMGDMSLRSEETWDARAEEEAEHRRLLAAVSKKWESLTEDL